MKSKQVTHYVREMRGGYLVAVCGYRHRAVIGDASWDPYLDGRKADCPLCLEIRGEEPEPRSKYPEWLQRAGFQSAGDFWAAFLFFGFMAGLFVAWLGRLAGAW